MTGFLRCIILCFVLLISGNAGAYASHAAGGEITYEWLGGSRYRFYLKFYRDCVGQAIEPTQSLCYYNACNNVDGYVIMQLLNVLPDGRPNGLEISPGCPGNPTNCTDPSSIFPGYREWWYMAEYTLPSQCDYWTFHVSIVDRNASTNLTSGLARLYIEATLNNRDAPDNSSPYFTVVPVPYICVNSPYTFNNGIVEPDGDSLTFEMIAPRTALIGCRGYYTANNISFQTGLSLTEPLPTGGTFNFNTTTGEMSFRPVIQGANTVSVRVNEYRNGVKIGSVMRDVQIQVLSCNSPGISLIPVAGSVSGGRLNGGVVEGGAGQPLQFCYNVVSDSPGRKLVVRDNHQSVIPGSVITYSGQGGNPVQGCFSWSSPLCNDTGLYILSVTVQDTTCDPPGVVTSRTFTLPVYISGNALSDREYVICRGAQIQLHTTAGAPGSWTVLPDGSPLSSLSCTSCSNPVARPDTTTTYEVVAQSGGCMQTERITVRIDEEQYQLNITPETPHVQCKMDSLLLDINVSGPPPLINLSCGAAGATPSTPQDSVTVMLSNTPFYRTANPVSTPFNGNYYTTSRHQYLIRAADMKASGMFSGTLRSIAFNISSTDGGALYENMSIAMACTDKTELDRNAGFVTTTTPVYTAPGPVAISSGAYVYFNFSVPYEWDGMQNLVVDICYSNPASVSPVYTGYYQHSGYVSTLYSNASSGNLCGNTPSGGIYTSYELPQMRFSYHTAPAADYSCIWGGSNFIPAATVRNPAVYVQEDTRIWVQTYTRQGCLISDTLDILVADSFYVHPEEATVCYGDTVHLHAVNSKSTQWYEDAFAPAGTLSCSSCNTTVAAPDRDVVYTAVVSNEVGCTDTFYIPVSVTQAADVRILTPDTVIQYGQQIRLQATGAESYAWTPSGDLDDPASPSPFVRPSASGYYVVTGVLNSCVSYDSVFVEVDMRGRFFVPTAFSPNGDGKNDVFRIANLEFQELLGFSVFNRFGERIYHAQNNDNRGWDGMYKGTPQPVGTYFYLISIAYPDGVKETIRGDVSLIR